MYEYPMQQYQNPQSYNSNPYMARLEAMQSQMMQQQPLQNQKMELLRVNGVDGARAYQMPPNSVVPLFDGNEDILYVKSSDSAGFPSIRKFKLTEVFDTPAQPVSLDNFVTKQEFQSFVDELKGMISNGKQSVSEQIKSESHKSSSK